MKALLLFALTVLPAWAYPSVWTLADFNGDHRPDVARLAVTRHAILLPVDLDHDADLDLVLHEDFTGRPVRPSVSAAASHPGSDPLPYARIRRRPRPASLPLLVPPIPIPFPFRRVIP